ncbi:unnamed protein product [Nezara viridula]|uniref:Neuropeptide n=1 Tax=Nezara viridula TaxID=85310 RepID=A0A9P0GY66_NEZVI|nr:unnamed protein product [Nezara viridula]
MFGVLLFISYLSSWTKAVCPGECSCGLDPKGRRMVRCTRGSMSGIIPVEYMESSIEVLNITAPEAQENWLTMGPVFQRFLNLEEVHITRSNIPAIGKHTFWGRCSRERRSAAHGRAIKMSDGGSSGERCCGYLSRDKEEKQTEKKYGDEERTMG